MIIIKLEYLQEFVVIARLNSFSAAAEALYITQSSLSKHIRTLEKELGIELFDRSKRQVALTEYGKGILIFAIQMCDTKSKMDETIKEYIQKEKTVVTIATIPVMAQYNIVEAVANFESLNPETTLAIHEYEGCDVKNLLESNSCELSFQRVLDPETTSFDFLEFSPDSLAAILPKNHRYANEKSIDLSQLACENFMFLDKQTNLYDFCYNACIKAHFTPNITYTSHRPENIIAMVKSGKGVSLLMKKAVNYFIHKDIVCLDLNPPVSCPIYLTKLKGRNLPPAADSFWNYIKENYTDKIKRKG